MSINKVPLQDDVPNSQKNTKKQQNQVAESTTAIHCTNLDNIYT